MTLVIQCRNLDGWTYDIYEMNTWEARRFHLDDRERMSVPLVGKVRKYSLMPHLDRCPEYHGTYKVFCEVFLLLMQN